MNIKIIYPEEAKEKLDKLSEEFVLIKNPESVYPEYEIVPLARKNFYPERIAAFVMDMDGTTTTTEELCIHSLEWMVRKMSGKISRDSWQGLDHSRDYPNIIGNSTTKHVEYLIKQYKNLFDSKSVIQSFIEALVWTFNSGKSEQRKREAKETIQSLGLHNEFEHLTKNNLSEGELEKLIDQFKKKLNLTDEIVLVRIGIEIYYQEYHRILLEIQSSFESEKSVSINSSNRLIEPLPGVAIFLSLVKGLLGEEAKHLARDLIKEFERKNPTVNLNMDINQVEKSLEQLGKYFEKNPVKIAVVTSSISYEANIVLSEVFKLITQEIKNWNLSEKRKQILLSGFSSYQNFYDAVVTATDAYEFRLKPHRDLYTIALNRLGISKENFANVIGFEDSQSGTIAIRSAGIGCCIAVPFPQTKNHNLEAASYILWNGLPEFILKLNCLIKF